MSLALAGGFLTTGPPAAAAAAKSLQSCPTLRLQPTRIPRPWGSPGKDTEVGCHCLLCGPPGKSTIKYLDCGGGCMKLHLQKIADSYHSGPPCWLRQ